MLWNHRPCFITIKDKGLSMLLLREPSTLNISAPPPYIFVCLFQGEHPIKNFRKFWVSKSLPWTPLLPLSLQSHVCLINSENWKWLCVLMLGSSITSSRLFYLPSRHCCYQAESADLNQVPRLRYGEGTASTLCTTSINSKTWSTCQ